MTSSTLPVAEWLSAPRPDDTVVAWSCEREWTLGQLRTDVSQLTQTLLAQPGERWALCFEDSYLFTTALLAALHAGKVPVIPGHRRIAVLREQHGLFSGILTDHPMDWGGPTLIVAAGAPDDAPPPALPPLTPDSYVELFTSGSTGQPRRVRKPVACLDNEAALLAQHFAHRLEGCRVVASVVPQHLYGLTFRIMLPMALGLPLHTAMLYYAEQLAALPCGHTYAFISSPAFLKRLDKQLAAPSLSLIISAGGMLPWQDVQHTVDWTDVTPDEIYGSTETGVLAWRYRAQDDAPWQPFPGVVLRQEQARWRVFSDIIPEREGLLLDDALHVLESGRFHLAGRQGRVVKIEEKRVSLSDIERRMLMIEGIHEVAALPVTRGGRQGVGVLVVLNGEGARQQQHSTGKQLELSWRRALLPWLEPVAIPRYWRIVDEIPVNSMNKRVYAQLEELFHDPS
ncbi:acyl-CoA synthetase [Cronobacter turicensis]|nr:acyl-CoA synthetase [Cronobacter turicensis]